MLRTIACLSIFVLSTGFLAGQETRPNLPVPPRASVPPAEAPRAPIPPAGENDVGAVDYVVEVKLLEGPGLREALDGVDAGSDSNALPQANPASPAKAQGKSADWATSLWDHQPIDGSGVTILCAPKISLFANQGAAVWMQGTRIFTYLEPLGNDTFQAKRTEPIELGMRLSLTVRPFDKDSRTVEVSPLELAMSVFEGRKPVEGLEVDAGEPIIVERVLKPSAVRVKLGEVFALAALGTPKNDVIMLVKVKRPERNNTALPSPPSKSQAIKND